MARIENCEAFIACLSAHFDGELEEELLVEFREHLERCEKARALVHTFERTIILHRGAQSRPIPRDVHARLIAAIAACSEEMERGGK